VKAFDEYFSGALVIPSAFRQAKVSIVQTSIFRKKRILSENVLLCVKIKIAKGIFRTFIILTFQ